jgi:hypothetical protein
LIPRNEDVAIFNQYFEIDIVDGQHVLRAEADSPYSSPIIDVKVILARVEREHVDKTSEG